MKCLKIIILAGILFYSSLYGQDLKPAVVNYVNTYRDLAIREMQRTGVPASITLAQGILETEAGTSNLVSRSNNHFGIKCKSWWNGEKVYHDDDERGECFRKYNSAEDSYRDHSDYLKSQPRYAFLFSLNPEDYKSWAFGLKKAGYATNPKYSHQLIKYIEDYHLDDYTMIAMGKKPYPADWVAYSQTGANDLSFPPQDTIQADIAGVNENPVSDGKQYPEGEFRINDTRVIYAKAGTSLLSLASQYKIKLKWLLDFNDLKADTEDILSVDQLIFLQRKRRQGKNDFHIVVPGENLYRIAQEEALRLDNLLHYNQLALGMQPAPGEKLYLRHAAPSRPRLAMAGIEPGNVPASAMSK